MRIIPVMDLLDGKTVHAQSGEREKYEPIQSSIAESTDPSSVASAFQDLGFKELYIADLNAIASNGDNLRIVDDLTSEFPMEVMIDGGFRTAEETKPYLKRGASKIVTATETLKNLEEIKKACKYDRPVVASIDLRGRRIIANHPQMHFRFPKAVQEFSDIGVSEILILSLDRVGTGEGPALKIISEALECTDLPLLVGGGVRNVRDIQSLKEVGASGVLIATALHDGSIKKEELNSLLSP